MNIHEIIIIIIFLITMMVFFPNLQDITMFPKPSVLIEIFLVILLKLNKKRKIYGR